MFHKLNETNKNLTLSMVQRLCVCCRSRVRDDGQAILFTPVRRNASQHSCSIYLDGATRSTSTWCRAETEEIPCHKPPHLSKSQILCCLSVNRTPIGSKELTTVRGTPGMSTHWPLSSLMLSRPLLNSEGALPTS